jgi:hypothetical protein
VSQGLYRTAYIRDARRLSLGEEVSIRGPGVLACDGDRERVLGPDEEARARVVREGPHVINVAAALRFAALHGLYETRHWSDAHGEAGDADCC